MALPLLVTYLIFCCQSVHPQSYGNDTESDSNPTYLILSPSLYTPGKPEKVCIELFKLTKELTVNFTLSELWIPYSWRERPEATVNRTLAEQAITINPGNTSTCFTMTVPESVVAYWKAIDGDHRMTEPDYLLLTAQGGVVSDMSGEQSWSFHDEVKVDHLRSWQYSKTRLTFIQPDKPIYKPGQLVQFRVVTLDGDLKPLTDMIDAIYITTPHNVRVEQWSNLTMDHGIRQLEYQMADEPSIGIYMITLEKGEHKEKKTFEVKEYVLPKYEVTITPPKYVTFQTEKVKATVCAKYTFGQPVRGTVEAEICAKRETFPWHEYDYDYNITDVILESTGQPDSRKTEDEADCTSLEQPLNENGCYDIEVTREDIGYDKYTEFEWGISLQIDARVRERGTGNYMNGTREVLEFKRFDIKVSMKGPKNFKPGIPYSAEVSVTRLDDVPVSGELIQIDIDDWGVYGSYSKNYTTDENGKVKFSLPPVAGDISSFTVQAKALRNQEEVWRNPSDYLSIYGWYSPSGSFLQINPKLDTIRCGNTTTFDIQYTTSIALDTELKYKVVGTRNILEAGSIQVNLTLNTPSEEPIDDDWDVSDKDECYWHWGRCHAPANNKTFNPSSSKMDLMADDVQQVLRGENASIKQNEKSSFRVPEDDTVDHVIATHKGRLSLDIEITPEMSPSIYLVVYYILSDGEVVADGVLLDIEICTENKAEMSFGVNEALPGSVIDINFRASPGSLCSYGMVDRSVFLEGGSSQLTLAKVLESTRGISLNQHYGHHERDCENENDSPSAVPGYYFYWSSPYRDSHSSFIHGGLAYMTNLKMETSPCIKKYYFSAGRDGSIEYESGAFELDDELGSNSTFSNDTSDSSDLASGQGGATSSSGNDGAPGVPGFDGQDDLEYTPWLHGAVGTPGAPGRDGAPGSSGHDGAFGAPGAAGRDGSPGMEGSAGRRLDDSAHVLSQTIRAYFPETWLWDIIIINEVGSAELSSRVPDTITEWVGNAICLSSEDGLGITEPLSLTAFQSFFVSMDLPYSVIREEKLPVAVTISNYQSKCMAVRLSIDALHGYRIDEKSEGYKCVCGHDTTTETFTIIMRQLGDVNISINAEVVDLPDLCPPGSEMTSLISTSDTVIRPVIVEPEGTPREYTISDFICMTTPDDPAGTTGSSSTEYTLPLPPADELVPDSERAYVRVVGDVMGPALSHINELLMMPHGCAEQTMVSFAPNIFILRYLEAINKDKPGVREKAIKYMKSGYARELTYAHNDQSYSSFGTTSPEKPGSMWLTAFVVKCFGLATPYITIDKTVQRKSIRFFTKHQDKDGCFPQIGTVHNKYMQGGIGQTGTNKAALTAFVAISIMESGLKEDSLTSLQSAFGCIDQQSFEDGYTTSIVAYAHSMYKADSEEATGVLSKLDSMAVTENGMTHWKANASEVKDDKLQSRWWYRSVSADTETTAYVLLAKLNMIANDEDKITQGLPIVRWLSTQRNPYGGFGSTQDTVLGLQALSEFAKLIYSDGLKAAIQVKEAAINTTVATFALSSENSFVEFSESLPSVKNLNVRATGTGCFLIQTNVRYNINKPDPSRQAFFTTTYVFRKFGAKDSCATRTMRVCSTYNGEGGVSNMAIISVKMVSGWVAEKSSLKNLVKADEPVIERYEIDKDGTVQLYFEKIDRKQVCLLFDLRHQFEVENAKPATVITYDYYKTELRHEDDYEIPRCRPPNKSKHLPIIF